MNPQATRRTFLTGLGAVAASATLPSFAAQHEAEKIRYGYAAITWANEERQAAEDIAAVGFPGVQFRANAVTDFKPAELKELLAKLKLTFVALSSGELSIEKPEADEIATHVKNAQFLKSAGGQYLQVLDQLKTYPRSATPDECKRIARLLTEVGKRTADIGVPLGYHNHLNTLSENPENLDRIMDAIDPKYVKLELDVAHLVAGGGDPAKAILKYHDQILFLHLKDVRKLPAGTPNPRYPFQWVELGEGIVDLPAVFKALKQTKFSGWAVVELDRVPDSAKTPKGCAETSKKYLETKIGVKV